MSQGGGWGGGRWGPASAFEASEPVQRQAMGSSLAHHHHLRQCELLSGAGTCPCSGLSKGQSVYFPTRQLAIKASWHGAPQSWSPRPHRRRRLAAEEHLLWAAAQSSWSSYHEGLPIVLLALHRADPSYIGSSASLSMAAVSLHPKFDLQSTCSGSAKRTKLSRE